MPDGEVRDVTREAFLESANTEVAVAGQAGLITAVRRGEAPILARFEGNYASTTLTVMGDRTGFVWAEPPAYGKIDELVAAKWKRMKILPSGLCTDAEFLRRVYLDLTGLPPTADDVRKFLADTRDSRVKRDELVDRLIGSPEFVDYWTNKWADLLQVNRKFLGVEGSVAFRNWIRAQVAANTPYDKFVRAILTASGSNRENPAAAYFKILRDPAATMENTTQLFLAVRFNCNKCHDHPFERWTQDQYYQTAAYFAQVGLSADPASKGRMIGGTDVEAPKPLFEVVADTGKGEVIHDRTKKVTAPKFPYSHALFQAGRRRTAARRAVGVADLEGQPLFRQELCQPALGLPARASASSSRSTTSAPATRPRNPELLDYLTEEFIKSGFDVRHVMRLICKSRTYQLSVETNKWNADDKVNYAHATARRLPAEVLLDAVYRVTGSVSKFPGVAAGTRAAALPDSGVELPSGFLTTFGRPARESACECERSSGLQLGPGHGPGQRSDPRRRHRRSRQRADQAGGHPERRRQADRRAVHEDPQPAGDRRGGRDLPQGHAGRRRRPPPDGRGARQARDRVRLEAARCSSASARRPSPRPQAALAAYEKELAPKLAEAAAQEGRGDRQARGRPQGVRDHGPRQENGRLGKGEGGVDRQPMAGARAQDHRAPPTARP